MMGTILFNTIGLLLFSAGLLWGPIYVKSFKLYVTKPHWGYAGPKVGKILHTNIYVDKCKAPKDCEKFLNFHYTKYKQGNRECRYLWESETDFEIDTCSDGFDNKVFGAILENGVAALVASAFLIITSFSLLVRNNFGRLAPC